MAARQFAWGALSNLFAGNNRQEKIPKGLGAPASIIPLCQCLQPFPRASITPAVPGLGLRVHLPLPAPRQLPWEAWKLQELQLGGC